ncbi:hypothetical protein GCM10010207_46680 [Streptomyces atratus]|nr:hypothetical protein GCM10010207_46680 [Streptomyces atratus]
MWRRDPRRAVRRADVGGAAAVGDAGRGRGGFREWVVQPRSPEPVTAPPAAFAASRTAPATAPATLSLKTDGMM